MNDLKARLEKIAALNEIAKSTKYQVRFWTNELAYNDFKAACERTAISYQDAFNEFMLWYSEQINPESLKEYTDVNR